MFSCELSHRHMTSLTRNSVVVKVLGSSVPLRTPHLMLILLLLFLWLVSQGWCRERCLLHKMSGCLGGGAGLKSFSYLVFGTSLFNIHRSLPSSASLCCWCSFFCSLLLLLFSWLVRQGWWRERGLLHKMSGCLGGGAGLKSFSYLVFGTSLFDILLSLHYPLVRYAVVCLSLLAAWSLGCFRYCIVCISYIYIYIC